MKFAKKTDIVLIAVIAVSALGLLFVNKYFSTEKGEYAEIYYDSVLVYKIKLSGPPKGSFSIPGKPEVVFQHNADGSIAFIKSDCPDKICIRSGRLRFTGQFAACLPNRLVLKIVSKDKDNKAPDLITK